MAADHLEFLKVRFIREFDEARARARVEFEVEFPLDPEFQNIQEFLENWSINHSTPIEMKNGLYDLIYELEECSILAEKEGHRKRQNQKGRFNVYTVKKHWFIHKTRNKLLQIKGNLEKLEANATVESSSLSDSISTVCSLWNSSWLQQHSPSEIHGLDDKLQGIKALLLQQADNDDGGIKTIGIVGMSGIGKTTLARMVVNDKDCRVFSPIIWVTLSENLNPSEIMRQLLETLSDNIDNDAQIISHDAHPEQQLRELLSNKKYLIVLDNAWHPNDWYSDLGSNLQTDGTTRSINRLCHGLPKGGGGAIIVTSGFEEVATSMVGDQNLFRLHPTIFNAEAVWSMFMDSIRRKEFLTPNQHQTLSKMKGEIIGRCDGLPLAAKTLAEIISTQMGKKEYKYWSDLLLRKKFHLRLDQLDDISYNKAMKKVRTLQGVEDVNGSRDGVITIIGRCLPVESARELGKLWHTELISVEQIEKIAQEVSFFHKKIVLKVDLHGDKDKIKAMKIVSKISGPDSISVDMKEKKLTVVGDHVDPVRLVSKIRKYWYAELLSVGPVSARQPPKKEKCGTKMLFSSIFRCSCINQIKE